MKIVRNHIIVLVLLFASAFVGIHAQNINHPTTAQQESKRIRKVAERPDRIITRKRPLPLKNIITAGIWIDFAVAFDYEEKGSSASSPVEISSAEQLAYLAQLVNDGNNFAGKHFKLTADINLAGREWIPIGKFGDADNDDTFRFCGSFQGGGHKIANLTITDGGDYTGLFGVCGAGALIENVHLVDYYVIGQMSVGGLIGELIGGAVAGCSVSGYIVASHEYVGGLVGVNGGKITNSSSSAEVYGNSNDTGGLVGVNGDVFPGTIDNCIAEGKVTGYWNVGGLAGRNADVISNSRATGIVEGEDWVGGLVGWTDKGIIESCYASGEVIGFFDVGGLVGFNGYMGSTVKIANSSASGIVTGYGPGNHCIGGLAGYSGGIIINSHATGVVDGESTVGGLVGDHGGKTYNSYATGAVHGYFDTGGLVGHHRLSIEQQVLIENCWSSGKVTGYRARNYGIGGLAGYSGGTIIRSFSTSDTSGEDTVGGLVGEQEGEIIDCFATGPVTARITGGGLVGWNWGTIENSFAAGHVNSRRNGGGFIGQNQDKGAIVTNAYFDRQATSQTRGAGVNNNEQNSLILPLTTEEFKNGELPIGFDASIWEAKSGEYPRLRTGE